MANWIKNLIGLAFVVVVLGLAKQVWFDRVDAEVNIREGTIKTINVPTGSQAPPAEASADAKSNTARMAECRLPEHGLESWGKTQVWTADSGWRRGGSSPQEFCGAQKLARERKFPDRTVVLTAMPPEDHKTVRDPFKHDFYRYTCVFEDRWEPVYKVAADEKCKA